MTSGKQEFQAEAGGLPRSYVNGRELAMFGQREQVLLPEPGIGGVS